MGHVLDGRDKLHAMAIILYSIVITVIREKVIVVIMEKTKHKIKLILNRVILWQIILVIDAYGVMTKSVWEDALL